MNRKINPSKCVALGEAIVFGSAFQIATRVQFDRPYARLWSQTAVPNHEWRTTVSPFSLSAMIEPLNLGAVSNDVRASVVCQTQGNAPSTDPDDDFDF